MIKHYCILKDNNIVVYKRDEQNNEEMFNDYNDIIKAMDYLSHFNTIVKISYPDIQIICKQLNTSFIVFDYNKILSEEKYKELKEIIENVMKNGMVYEDKKISYNPPTRKTIYTRIVSATSLILSGVIAFAVFNGFKPKTLEEPSDGMQEPKTSETKSTKEQLTIVDDPNIIFSSKKDKGSYSADTSVKKRFIEDDQFSKKEETKVKYDIATEKEMLKEYFNVNSIEKLDEFFNEFIKNMIGYNIEYTADDLTDIFFEVSEIPLENKIQVVKETFNLTDEELDSVAATLVAEGYGGGTKYIDVYAATTTALNRIQYPAWVCEINQKRGNGLGSSLHGQTCYYNQFQAYGSDNYRLYLGNRTLTGFKSVIDTLYINEVYGLILHNYTQFRGNWIDVPNGYIFETGGNKYLDKRNPEDRSMPEERQKNNSTI